MVVEEYLMELRTAWRRSLRTLQDARAKPEEITRHRAIFSEEHTRLIMETHKPREIQEYLASKKIPLPPEAFLRDDNIEIPKVPGGLLLAQLRVALKHHLIQITRESEGEKS